MRFSPDGIGPTQDQLDLHAGQIGNAAAWIDDRLKVQRTPKRAPGQAVTGGWHLQNRPKEPQTILSSSRSDK